MDKEYTQPAFPNPRWEGWGQPEAGMDLRDYFAAKAMQGLLADHSVKAGIMRIADEEDASEEEVLAENNTPFGEFPQ